MREFVFNETMHVVRDLDAAIRCDRNIRYGSMLLIKSAADFRSSSRQVSEVAIADVGVCWHGPRSHFSLACLLEPREWTHMTYVLGDTDAEHLRLVR
jgi:hypothetical protein